MLEGHYQDIVEDCATYIQWPPPAKKILDDKECVKITHKNAMTMHTNIALIKMTLLNFIIYIKL